MELRYFDGDEIVTNIQARDALLNKFNGMKVTVEDASADPLIKTGWAIYQWNVQRNKFIVISKESVDTLLLKKEAIAIANGKATLSHVPKDGVLWDCFIANQIGEFVTNYNFPMISGNEVTIGNNGYDGMSLNVVYSYGSIEIGMAGGGTSGVTSYNDLSDKPTIPAEQVQSNWNESDANSKAFIQNKPSIPAAQVQADWNAIDGLGVILNKPAIPTVPTNVSEFTNDVHYLTSETVTKLKIVNNVLSFTDESGVKVDYDLSVYLDNNISAIINATYNATTKKMVFTRENNSTFELDASVFFDDTNLVLKVNGKTGDLTLVAADIPFTPSGNISAITVKGALEELDSEKVDKVTGKQLSTEDYTTTEKNKLAELKPANEIVLTASGDIPSANLTVALGSDGTVEVVKKTTIASQLGSTVTHNNAATGNIDSCTIGGKIIVAFVDDADTYKLKVVVGTISGTSISFGAEYAATTGNSYEFCITKVSNNSFAISYKDSDLNTGRTIVGSFSGTVVTFGTSVAFNATRIGEAPASCYDTVNSKLVVCFKVNSSSLLYCAVGTISGTTISFSSLYQIYASAGSYLACEFNQAIGKVVVSFISTGIRAIIGTISGTSISFGTPVLLSSGGQGQSSIAYDEFNQKIVIGYNDGGHLKAVVGTISGTNISFGTPVLVKGSTSYINLSYESTTHKIAIISDKGTAISIVLGLVSGNTISLESELIISSSSANGRISICYDSATNKIAASYTDYTNGSLGKTAIVSLAVDTTNANNFIGFSSSAATSGQAVNIKIGNEKAVSSSLIAGSKYYLNMDGTLTTTNTGLPRAGRALSETELLIANVN